MGSKKCLSGRPKGKAHPFSEKNCCEPRHLLDEITTLRASEETESKAKPAKIRPVTICFKAHRAKVLRPKKTHAAVKKVIHIKQKASLKLKTEVKVLKKQVAASKAAAKTPMRIPSATKAVALQKLPSNKKAAQVKKPSVIEEPIYEKKPKTEETLIDHNLDIIKPVENHEIEIVKYTAREKPLNVVKDFETEADEALLKKGLTEPAQATEPEISADFRTKPAEKKWFGKRQLAPPPRPPQIKPELQPEQKQDVQKKSFWQGMFKPKAKKIVSGSERPEIDKKITKRMMKHKGAYDFEDSEAGDLSIESGKAEKRQDIFKGPEIQGGRGEWTIKSQLDEVLDMINEQGSINAREIAKKLGVGLDVVEGWGKVLEENKLIEIHYPAMGEPNFTKPGFIERKEVKSRKKEY